MSPRVVRWNHRYFAPTDSSVAEREAAELIDVALNSRIRDDSIVHAEHMVEQVSTGRVNPEALLVRDARLAGCPPDVRARAEAILRESLPAFGNFVAGLTEAEGASSSLVKNERFDNLVRGVLEKLAPVLKDAEEARRARERTPTPRESRKRRLTAAAACLAVAAAFVYFMTPQTPQTSEETPRKSEAPVAESPSNKKRPGEVRKWWDGITKRLGDIVPRSSASPERPNLKGLSVAVLGKTLANPDDYVESRDAIIKELKDGLDPEDRTASIPTSSDAPEDELRGLLNKYYSKIYSKDGKDEDLKELLDDIGFIKELERVFTDHREARVALEQFKCTGPRHFHNVFNAFVELQGAIDKLSKDRDDLEGFAETWQRDFIWRFPKGTFLRDPLHPRGPSDSTLRLYRDEDRKDAEAIVTLLRSFKDVPSSIEGVKGSNPVAWLHDRLRDSKDEWGSQKFKPALESGKYGAAFKALEKQRGVWFPE